jgi:capsular polysaccharide export protein
MTIPPAITPLCFSWSTTGIVELYDRLFRLLAGQMESSPVFLSSGPEGKLRLLQRGFPVYTLAEMFDFLPAKPLVEVPEDDLEELASYDRLLGWHRRLPRSRRRTGGEHFRTMAQAAVDVYTIVLHEHRPNVVYTWNGVTLFQKALAYVARRHGLPVFYFERGLLPDTLSVDPEGVNFASSLAGERWPGAPDLSEEERARAESDLAAFASAGRTIVARGHDASPAELRESLSIPPDARVVLLPLQIEWDSNILKFSPHFKKMPDIIRSVQEALGPRDDVYTIVKPHPEDKNRLGELQALCGPRTRLATEADLHSLLRVADAVVTVNSTVGFEALMRRLPVVVLGQALYAGKGFTHDLDEGSRLGERLSAALSGDSFNDDAFLRFYVQLRRSYLLTIADDDPWESRRLFAERVARAAFQPELPSIHGLPAIAPLKRQNAALRRILTRPAKRAVVLGKPTEWLSPLLAPEAECLHLERHNVLSQLPGAMLRKHDAVYTIGEVSPTGRLLGALLRARRKITLK